MNRKAREPFLIARLFNVILGIAILVLFLMILVKRSGTELYEILLFALGAVENFIGATINFLEGKRLRGNIYAAVCGIFLIVAIVLAISYFVFV